MNLPHRELADEGIKLLEVQSIIINALFVLVLFQVFCRRQLENCDSL